MKLVTIEEHITSKDILADAQQRQATSTGRPE